ncbi:RNA methyltransferase [Archaeoglobus sulfaticallidus]|nr:RNA methyltransferase [Archaeoglobus sulfaticallidus]
MDVCLVELKTPENIGFVARVMKNFGFKNLVLYNCNVSDESYITASHAKDVLENALIVENLEDYLSEKSLVVGTTGITTLSDETYLRKPVFYPDELSEHLKGKAPSISILFGREDYGLYNEEIKLCDVLVSVPTSPEYPVMNVSHAVAVLLYELRGEAYKIEEKCYVKNAEIDRLISYFEDLLNVVRYPKHRIPRTLLMLKRVNSRALMTKNEYTTYLGVVRKIKEYIEKLGRFDGNEKR